MLTFFKENRPGIHSRFSKREKCESVPRGLNTIPRAALKVYFSFSFDIKLRNEKQFNKRMSSHSFTKEGIILEDIVLNLWFNGN